MPLPVLASQSYISAPGLVTPAIHLYPQGEPTNRKQTLEYFPEGSRNYCPAPFRDGLPTPPSDMTGGVAYNAISASSYGGPLNRVSLHPYAAAQTNSRISRGPPSNATMPQVKSQSNPGSTNASSRVLDQKKQSSGSVAPYMQIPSSISSGKGSMAEFAAQVRKYTEPDSVGKLPRY